jgi:hypothetical protein
MKPFSANEQRVAITVQLVSSFSSMHPTSTIAQNNWAYLGAYITDIFRSRAR